jgi:hypothetical protein
MVVSTPFGEWPLYGLYTKQRRLLRLPEHEATNDRPRKPKPPPRPAPVARLTKGSSNVEQAAA